MGKILESRPMLLISGKIKSTTVNSHLPKVLDFRQNDLCEFHLWSLVGGRLEDLPCQCQCSVFSKREEVGWLCLNTNSKLQTKDAAPRHFHENPKMSSCQLLYG
jgi:hypothetical protein